MPGPRSKKMADGVKPTSACRREVPQGSPPLETRQGGTTPTFAAGLRHVATHMSEDFSSLIPSPQLGASFK